MEKEEKMDNKKFALLGSLTITLMVLLGLAAPETTAKTLYVGGSFGITSPSAKESSVVLAAFEDYVAYVNETKQLAPWRKEKFPSDVTLEVLWRDDEWKPAKALSIYEELKAKGMMVYRASGSSTALALKDRLKQDNIGATSMASGAYLLSPPQTIFTLYPIYTDANAAIADWFKENWKESRKPRVAYLTADNAMGVVSHNILLEEGWEFSQTLDWMGGNIELF